MDYGWSPGSCKAWSPDEETYGADDWYGTWDDDGTWDDEAADETIRPDEQNDLPEESQLREAFALAGEANRALKEARAAVKRVRQSRGYFAPSQILARNSLLKDIFPPRYAICIGKCNISRSGYLPEFHHMLRLPRKVTLRHHQMLCLLKRTLQQYQRVHCHES